MKKNISHIAHITLFAFLLNAILPFFAVYNFDSYQISSNKTSSIFGEKLLICTADGFKWIAWDALPNTKDNHHTPSTYKCAVCYVAAHGLKDVLIPDTVILIDIAITMLNEVLYVAPPVTFAVQLMRHSRAPPTRLF